jgi:hypothetical protein
MTVFWIAVVVGAVVAVAYVALAVQAFARVRQEVLAAAAGNDQSELDVHALEDERNDVFTWKAAGAVVVSTTVIVLLGVNGVFWYVPAILAIGSSVAVVAAFFIDRKRTI